MSLSNRQFRPGFTLLEAVLSSFILAIIMVALMSIFRLAGGAASASAGMTFPQSGEVLDQIATDVSLAQAFTEKTANAITLTVPDRTGDGQADTIRYSWSGVSGASLMRQLNGGTAVAIAGDVRYFNLGYLARSVPASATGGGEGGGGNLLMQHDDAPGGTMKDYKVDGSHWCAQYFMPTLPQGTTAWTVTRVAFCAKSDSGTDGSIVVQLRDATIDLKPGTTVLASTEILESTLGTAYAWVTLNMPGGAILDPAKGYCVVIKYGGGGGTICDVQYEDGGSPMPSNTHFMTSGNGGGSWSAPNSTQDMRFRVYGTVTP